MKLFENATIKLAGWYLIILMSVSLLFSVIIFQVTRSEIASRLNTLSATTSPVEQPPAIQQGVAREHLDNATASLVVSLGYINLIVLVGGGAGAYALARQTLKPIQSALEAQSRFVSNASHQFRTPLAIMKAEAELALADKSATKSTLRQALASNLEEVDHLSTLSGMLLELSQSEEAFGRTTDEINLTDLTKQVIKKHSQHSRITLTAPDTLNIYSYEAAIREIISITLDNSIKHSPAGSKVHIELTANRQSTSIVLKNQGLKSSQKHLPHAFERFYRSTEKPGYGLGLPLAKQLAKALGGSISIRESGRLNILTSINLPQK